jgi:hypothetical protein
MPDFSKINFIILPSPSHRPVRFLRQVSGLKICMQFSFRPSALHATPPLILT